MMMTAWNCRAGVGEVLMSQDVKRAGGGERPGPAEHTLGEKIEWLIIHRWPDSAPPPRTNADVAEAITAATGEELSSTGIWKLRTGRGDNPTLKTMTAMARFFDVPVGYFGEGEAAESIGDEVALLALLRGNGISRQSLRAMAGLSGPGRQAVTEIIETIARMEQVQAAEGGAPETAEQ
jgi:transcriptional regulator with XRE-family HTH domain